MHFIGRLYTYTDVQKSRRRPIKLMKQCYYFSFLSKSLHIHLWGSYGNPLTCCFLFINPPAVHSNEPKGNISLLSHHSFNSQPLLCVFCSDFLILTFSRCSSKKSSAMKESVWYPLHFVWKLWSHCRPVIAMQCIFVHIQNLITCTFHDRSAKPTVILQPFFSSQAVINPMIDCGCALMRKAEMHRENSSLMYHIKIWCTAVLFQITLNNSLAFRKWDVHLCRLFTALKLLLFFIYFFYPMVKMQLGWTNCWTTCVQIQQQNTLFSNGYMSLNWCLKLFEIKQGF